MKLPKIISSSIKGTTAMTIFSYLYSRGEHRQFREPVLLAHLLAGKKPKNKVTLKNRNIIGGWALHYLVGISFLYSYHKFRQTGPLGKLPVNGAVLGGLYGIVGVFGWKTMFYFHPDPPRIPFKHYYAHLIPAHMIYGHFAFKSLDAKKDDEQ